MRVARTRAAWNCGTRSDANRSNKEVAYACESPRTPRSGQHRGRRSDPRTLTDTSPDAETRRLSHDSWVGSSILRPHAVDGVSSEHSVDVYPQPPRQAQGWAVNCSRYVRDRRRFG